MTMSIATCRVCFAGHDLDSPEIVRYRVRMEDYGNMTITETVTETDPTTGAESAAQVLFVSAFEASKILEVGKDTVMCAIRDGRLPSFRDERGRFMVMRDEVDAYAHRRGEHRRQREALREQYLREDPHHPPHVPDEEWAVFLVYVLDPEMTYSDLSRIYGRSRQRWQQIILKIRLDCGLS